MGVRYRLAQFWRTLTAGPLPDAVQVEIQAVLTPGEYGLFRRFAPGDQRHGYDVMQTLRAAGHADPALLAAALLHDIGKTRARVTVLDRTLVVLFGLLAPARMEAWGQGEPAGWQRPFVVKVQHPAWGAEMAAAAGSTSRTVALILRHQDALPATDQTEEDRLLRQLQWADDLN